MELTQQEIQDLLDSVTYILVTYYHHRQNDDWSKEFAEEHQRLTELQTKLAKHTYPHLLNP